MKKNLFLRFFIFTGLMVLAPLLAKSEEASLDLQKFNNLPTYVIERVTETPVQVGSNLEMRVRKGNPNWKVDLPPGADDLVNEGWDIEADPNSELRFRAIPIKAGKIDLPPLLIRDAQGEAVGKTTGFSVEAQSVISSQDRAPTEPVPPKPPLGLNFPVWAVAALAVLGLVFLFLLIYAMRRVWDHRKLKTEPQAPVRKQTEDEIALALLAKLEGKEYLKNQRFKAHYFKLSEIMKEYVGARYDFDAEESTSEELVRHLESLATGELSRTMADLFQKLDLVKFTDFKPEPREGVELTSVARNWILKTRRPPPMSAEPTEQKNAIR